MTITSGPIAMSPVMFPAGLLSDATSILKIIDRTATAVMPFGIAGKEHRNGDDFIASFHEKRRSDGTIHAPAERGEHTLKGVPGEWRIYAVRSG